MKRPNRFLIRMILFLCAVAGVAAVLFVPLRDAFMANAPLNGLILGVLFLGVIYNFRQVATLYAEVDWLDHYRRAGSQASLSLKRPPRLLASVATLLGERSGDRLRLSALSTRTILDSISSRLDEAGDISRYTIGLLIFLGLLGTFWGLLETVSAVGAVIGGLSIGEGTDLASVFGDLKKGLEAPLSGMGTAFSSSLFGLAGSLALGFLDLQAGQAQNRFYNDLEEWLSSLTQLSSGAFSDAGDQSVPVYVQALLEQTAESLENLQHTLARGEDTRNAADAKLLTLVDKIETLTDHMRTEQRLMMNLAETQADLKNILAKLADGVSDTGGGMDEATRIHIRNVDVYLARVLEEMGRGRDEIVRQVRSEIKLLARTIAALAEEER